MTDAPAAPRGKPLAVLTGFLGSGKTTLLSKLLRHADMAGAAVIVNEFGEVGLDDALLETGEERLVLLASGCVCCTVRGDMVDTLERLERRAAAGEIPAFDRVVMETTGLADPAPILHTLMNEPRVAARYRLDAVVTTVDAQLGEATLDRHFEAVKQAAVADRLVLTKTDLVAAQDAQRLVARLRRINPAAALRPVVRGEVAPAALFGAGLYDAARRCYDAARWLRDEAYGRHDHADGPHGWHDDGIASFCLRYDQALDWDALAEALELLVEAYGDRLLRVKGIVRVRQSERPVVIQGVQHLFYPPGVLAHWPPGERASRIVFITRGLEAGRVGRLLAPLLD